MRTEKKDRHPLLLLTDSLSSRVFFSSGIVQRLWRACRSNIEIVALFDISSVFDYRQWLKSDENISVKSVDVFGINRYLSISNAIKSTWDKWLDKYIGFFPLAVRFSILHNYHLCRFQKRHQNPFLNLSLAFPFPKSRRLFYFMYHWYFNSKRFISPPIIEYLEQNISYVIPTNLQFFSVQKYLFAADRLSIPIIGHIGSWDHPVGKGVVFPRCKKYIVQNGYMREKLVGQHDIPENKIIITGWPQMDLFSKRRNKREFRELLHEYRLDPEKPCILIAGNSEGNAPYEPNFVERFVNWWEGKGYNMEYSIIFRPHPRDIILDKWKTRYKVLFERNSIYVQSANYADIDILCLILQHVSCVVTNAGTILLDSIVNDRPVVCVLYDEGGPPGSSFALNNISGDHYRDLMKSDSFITAYDFESVTKGVRDSLENPSALKKQRKQISLKIVEKVDGNAGKRVADAILREIAV